MILRNHGLLTVGDSVDAAAWINYQPLHERIIREQPDLFE